MSDRPAVFLRMFAASLVLLSGLAQLGSLWLRELDGRSITDGVLGGVYLILALGLFGRSRFSLFMGILIPTVTATTLLFFYPASIEWQLQRYATDAVIALLCLLVLWRVRNEPSV